MTDHKMYSLYIDLYENGQLKDVRDFTEDERDVLCAEIEDLWMEQYAFEAHTREFRVGLSPEEDMLYLVYNENGYSRAFPSDCGSREITLGAPKVNERTLKLVGDRIPIRLPGRRVEVIFSDV